MNKVSVADINFRGRKALVRVDFNVPLGNDQTITDDRRIAAAIPTLKKILDDDGIVIACSHLGRPRGKHVPELSLAPVAKRLAELLGIEVLFAHDCIGPEASNVVDKLQPGQCVLLENLRFHAEETANDPDFARKLASLADIFVNDAFGTAHRAHASTEGAGRYFNQAVAGFLMEKEIRFLAAALDKPARPFAAILGGAKISGKIDAMSNLLNKVDKLLIGGGMAFTFAKAMGYSIGNSLLEKDKVELAREIIAKAKQSGVDFILPTDVVIAKKIDDAAQTAVVDFDKIPDGMIGLDIGPKSIEQFTGALKGARTVVWNGPMGVFEHKPFAGGTLAVATMLAEITASGAVTIVGGGDSAAAVSQCGLDDKLTHISTGGGASLELLEGKILPGLAALTDVAKAGKV